MNRLVAPFLACSLFLLTLGCGDDFGLGLQTGPPTASFTVNPTSAVYSGTPVSIDVNATASSAAYGRTITTYEWDFDYDGMTPNFTASGMITNALYNAPGTYTILLRVTDSEGATAQTTRTVNIQPGMGFVSADITVDINPSCIGNDDTGDDVLTFDASGSMAGVGDTLSTFDWAFGDSGTDTTTYPDTDSTHSYSSAGNYTASVTAHTVGGGSDTNTVSVKVVELTAAFTSPASSAPGVNVSVDASSSVANNTNITTYSWNWGDGTPAGSGATTVHQYSTTGSYTITLTVTDENGFTDTETAGITIADLAAVIYASDAAGTPADATTLTLQISELGKFTDENSVGAGIIDYAWDWEWTDTGTAGPDAGDFTGDENYASVHTSAAPLTHSYASAGTYTAVLRVDTGSNVAYDTITITVAAPPLMADMQVDLVGSPTTVNSDPNAASRSSFDTEVYPSGGYPYVYYAETDLSGGPAQITFDASISTGDILAYTFQWGDGTGDTIINPPTTSTTHDFTNEGIYEVRLDAVDSLGDHDYATLVITIVDTSAGHVYKTHLLNDTGGTGDQDTSIHAGQPDAQNWWDNHIHIDSYSGETQNILFQSDTSAYLTADLTKGGIILFCYRENGCDNNETLHVYEAQAAWTEDVVTWNTRPGQDTTTDHVDAPGYVCRDFTGTRNGGTTQPNDERPNHPMFIPCTSLLNLWRSNPSGNLGAYIVAEDGNIDLSFMSDGYQGNSRNPIIIGIQ